MGARWKGPTPNLAVQNRQLTEARTAEPWLADGSVTVQQQALRDLDQAWRNFYAGTVEVVPGDPGPFRTLACRVRCDPRTHPRTGTGEIVGVDRGVKHAVALSTGELTSPAGLRPKEAARLLRLQRKLARAQRGSNRRRKVKAAIARLKAREGDRRRDWTEKTSTDLARRFDLIRVEDLNVKAMTRSARGTIDTPGRNVRQKAGLNRGILAQGWSQILTRTEQKAPGRVEKINPAYTSQTCNTGGHCVPDNRESQAVFRCVACGHQANADVNTARNIADRTPAAGRAVAARADQGAPARSVKREPQRARPPKIA